MFLPLLTIILLRISTLASVVGAAVPGLATVVIWDIQLIIFAPPANDKGEDGGKEQQRKY